MLFVSGNTKRFLSACTCVAEDASYVQLSPRAPSSLLDLLFFDHI